MTVRLVQFRLALPMVLIGSMLADGCASPAKARGARQLSPSASCTDSKSATLSPIQVMLEPEIAAYFASDCGLSRVVSLNDHPDLPSTLSAPETRKRVVEWLATRDAASPANADTTAGALRFVRSGAKLDEVPIARAHAASPFERVRLGAYDFLVLAFWPPTERACLLDVLRSMLSDRAELVAVGGVNYVERAKASAEELHDPEMAIVESDVRTIVGGRFSPDHIGPDAHTTMKRRAQARAKDYLDELERRFSKLDPSMLSSLSPLTLLKILRTNEPARVRVIAARLSAQYESALNQHPVSPGSSEERIRLADQLREARALAR